MYPTSLGGRQLSEFHTARQSQLEVGVPGIIT